VMIVSESPEFIYALQRIARKHCQKGLTHEKNKRFSG
jgi:hypothetical protein